MEGWYDLSSTFQSHEQPAQGRQARLRPQQGTCDHRSSRPEGIVQESAERVPLTEVQEARNGQYD